MEGVDRVGQPKKYSQPWKSLAKRIYLEEDTFSTLRQLKITNSFSSDDATVRHLINHHQSLCLLETLASSTEAERLGGRSVAETGNVRSENIAQNVLVTSTQNLLTGAAENTIETEQCVQSEVLFDTRERDLLCSGEQSVGGQYKIASQSCFDNDFDMTATTSTPARNHKRP